MESIPAIYEDGVFKPVGEVSLPEKTEVRVTVAASPPAGNDAVPDEGGDEAMAAARKAAWDDLRAELAKLPAQEHDDGWSAANNVDEILYGGPDGPA